MSSIIACSFTETMIESAVEYLDFLSMISSPPRRQLKRDPQCYIVSLLLYSCKNVSLPLSVGESL